jgi:hypothetical protein
VFRGALLEVEQRGKNLVLRVPHGLRLRPELFASIRE